MIIRVSIRDLPNPFPETEEVYGVTISNEEIRTVVTKEDSAIESWIEWISNEYDDDYINYPIVGLDVEWKPPFGPHPNHIATLQLCVDRRCLIFQIIHADGVPESIDGFLKDTNYRFVGVGIQSDVDKLGSDYNICVENVFDLRNLAAEKYGRKDLKNAGLMGLAGLYRFTPAQPPRKHHDHPSFHSWSTQPLPDTQEVYSVTVGDEEIRTVVTKNASTVDHWIERVYSDYNYYLNHLIVGLDVEWRPAYLWYWSLSLFCSNVATLFVGVGIQSDVEKLGCDYDISVQSVVDLGYLAAYKYGSKQLKNVGLMGLAGLVLGCGEIEKPRNVTMSNWDQYQLTEAQIRYACVDAYVSFKISKQLLQLTTKRQTQLAIYVDL
ncbi:hypothetical protein C5167_048793 [Papaver somniferum]|uniref:3'-5' exonuclease domain-containing protein n=1 Tax=Papaver somniferum TaxID=3469 RepID=A0A4Y7KKB1_PAPSO|nr:hypothetical protein C5167_048793 [Papaver somniferum]